MAKNTMEDMELYNNSKLQQAISAVVSGDTAYAVATIRSIPHLDSLLDSPDGAEVASLMQKAIAHNNLEVIQTLNQCGVNFDDDIINWALTEEKVTPQTIEELVRCGSKFGSEQLILALTYPGQIQANLHIILKNATLEPESLLINLTAALAAKNPVLFEQIINQTLENCKNLQSKSKFLHAATVAMSQSSDYTEQLKKAMLQLLQDPQAQDFVNITNILSGNHGTFDATPIMGVNDLDIVKLMHVKGANLNAIVPQINKSVISIVSGRLWCNSDLLDYLIENVSKKSITNIDNNGNSAVYNIAKQHPSKLVKLVERGVDIDVVNQDGLTPLVKLIIDSGEIEGVKTLIAMGAKIDTTKFSTAAMLKYAQDNNLNKLKTWLKIAQDVDSTGKNANPPKYTDLADNELYEMRMHSLEKIAFVQISQTEENYGKQEDLYFSDTEEEDLDLLGLEDLYNS